MRTPPLHSPSRTPTTSANTTTSAASTADTFSQRKTPAIPKGSSDFPTSRPQRPTLSLSQESDRGHTSENHGFRDLQSFKLSTTEMEELKAEDRNLVKVDRMRRHMNAQVAAAQRRDGSVGETIAKSSDSPRLSSMERFSTILEEAPLPQDATMVSPLLTGSQTVSTGSTNTVRGSAMPQSPGANQASTPSYPFPTISLGTATSNYTAMTSAFHKPFTALSPTIIPPAKASRVQPSRDRLASGQATPFSMAAFRRPNSVDRHGIAQSSGPDLYELSLILQSEPGLDAWWASVGRIMRDHFGAERASLAVPSDSTDLENVPWAQLATYNGLDEDHFSRATNRPQSTQSSLNDLSSQEDSRSESSSGIKETNAEKGGVNWTDTPATQSRPTLESRHSFAGFARKVDPSVAELKLQQSMVSGPTRPGTIRTASSVALHPGRPVEREKLKDVRLSIESLEHHLALEASKSPLSTNFSDVPERGLRGRVFPMMQTLEFEADPLLNSAGAVRVLERGKLIHITREYLDERESVDEKMAKQDAFLHSRITWPTPNRQTSKPQVEPPEISIKSPPLWNVKASPSLPRPRSLHSESSQSSSLLRGGKDDPLRKGLHPLAYEDYEQVPASSWSQSPAPSPAVQADPDVNPFFAEVSIDEDAFAEDPPAHDYSEDRQLEAIGVDRASSIVHVPLIHPLLSKPKRPPRFGSEGVKGKHRGLGDEVLPSIPKTSMQGRLAISNADKRTPIAILSILSPQVPYPSILSSSLMDLAPHLATTFYTAQQHSNLEKAVAGHSRRKYPHSDGFPLSGNHGAKHIPTSSLLSFVDKHEDGMSPSNTGSVTSASEYSSRSKYSPRSSVAGTPGVELMTHSAQDEQRTAAIPGHDVVQETNDSYFHLTRRQMVNRTDSAPLPTLASMNSRLSRGFPSASNKEPMQSLSFGMIQKPLTVREPRPVFSEVKEIMNASNTKPTPLPKIDESRGPLPGADEAILSNPQDMARADPRQDRDVSPSGGQSDLQESPRRQAWQQTLGQGHERSSRIHKHTHTYGGDFKATNPSLPATTTELASMPLPSGGIGAIEPEFAFRPPTSNLLRIMIDTGATQEFIADPITGHITWANSKFLTYRNEPEAEIGRRPWDNIHPKDQRTFRKLWANALHTGDQVSHQMRLRRFDSQYRWFHVRIVPIKDKHGIITQWHGQAMDIHEQHIAEVDAARVKEKAASESKYRSLANSNPHIIFAASVPGGMTFANTQWLSYSGQGLDQALGFGFLDHVHPDDVLKCRFPALSSQSVLPHLLETPSALRGRLVRRSSAISATEASDSTTVTDETVRANELDSPELEPLGTEAPTGTLKELIKDGVVKASTDGQGRPSIATEMRLRSKTGQYRWHLVQGSLIESVNFGQGDAQWIIACADISDQKHDEEKLKKANATLEQETTRKMQFLSTMSHEIRTPLNGVIGNLQFLLNSELNEYQSEWTFGAVAAARGMHELINDILDVSKAEAKMLKLYFDWFHVRSVIEDVFETLSSKADEKRLDLCYAVSEDVPSQVKGDGGRIRQVLLNLVGNAIKFTQKGEIFVECKVPTGSDLESSSKLGKYDIYLLFNVVDTGSGFTQEDAKILFQPYSQIDNSNTRSNGGTGLGLLLCKQMVELHGGRISATSVPGMGSTFTFFARFKLPTLADHPTVEKSALSRTNSSISSAAEIPHRTVYAAGHHSLFQPSLTESPGPLVAAESELSQESPLIQSSGSSNPSINSVLVHRSTNSSATSIDKDETATSIKLTLPMDALGAGTNGRDPQSLISIGPMKVLNVPEESPSSPSVDPSVLPLGEPESFHPPMYSILIVCPQENTRRTTQDHIQQILPKSIPAQITSRNDIAASQSMITGDDPITFTHVVLVLREPEQVIVFLHRILNSVSHPHTCVVIVTDQAQKQQIKSGAPDYDYTQLEVDRRVRFLLKPAKPPKFASIFDPKGENALSRDQSRATAREAIDVQRVAFATFKEALGHKGIKVLAVEDNSVNMQMLTHFLGKICFLDVEKAWDGQQCLDKVFAQGPLYYQVIICDIQMPIKDGYVTCREIRKWEEDQKYPSVPIIALSANIMSEGRRDSAAAGFTNYTTKPVDWKVLGDMIMDLINPDIPHVLLRDRPVEAQSTPSNQ
ncbi:MAG: putative autoinducer 2 sensor kinase phosphatase luxQ [Lasallia pustulata]|uniref:histidine kinase n=1 Tax=Lasallia pustulata TaxID=136370 RepID=A0A5M8PXU2_9LECA|nr:MAG: putative autoinducer 2 sensor kinase phosphatase luxQ [Lasallia pustulata]